MTRTRIWRRDREELNPNQFLFLTLSLLVFLGEFPLHLSITREIFLPSSFNSHQIDFFVAALSLDGLLSTWERDDGDWLRIRRVFPVKRQTLFCCNSFMLFNCMYASASFPLSCMLMVRMMMLVPRFLLPVRKEKPENKQSNGNR